MKLFVPLFIFPFAFAFGGIQGCPEIKLPCIPCDTCEYQPIPPPTTCAYNTPARIDVRGCWGFYITGSYIYWMPKEENIELGVSLEFDVQNGEKIIIENYNVVDFEPWYRSGYKVGIGLISDYDHWDWYSEYTWFHQRQGASTDDQIIAKWLKPVLANQFPQMNNASGSWLLELDVIDSHLARTYYVGRRLVFRTHFGGRVAWLQQSIGVDYENMRTEGVVTFSSKNSSTSRGFGPRMGVDTNWMLGDSFRIFGKGAGSILYTEYDISQQQTNPLLEEFNIISWKLSDDTWFLRPNFELIAGLGYGTYFCCERYYVDFSASYEFHVFWNQNVFRHFYGDNILNQKTLAEGDLYLHGLTITLKVSF